MKINRNALIIGLSILTIVLLILNMVVIHGACLKNNHIETKEINTKDSINKEDHVLISLKRKALKEKR